MDIHRSSPLLGGLSPSQFMRRHWHKKPLWIKQAVPDIVAPIERQELFELASREGVESRLIRRKADASWTLRRGPLARAALPPLKQPGWTLLVQGVDLHRDAAYELLQRFRFVPDARLDDLMISYASNEGGVGPHVDSYDVFLLQVRGKRRWSIGKPRSMALVPGLPLKILADFEPEESHVLEPGDMLYLPPHYAHDGVAVGDDCMTCSIGLRAPAARPLGAELLSRIAEAAAETLEDEQDGPGQFGEAASALRKGHYRDPSQPASTTPAAMPAALQSFARNAVLDALRNQDVVDRSLGELLTEPKPDTWFDPGERLDPARGVSLDRRTRMLYDDRHLFINGESFRAAGRDARLMHRLADRRSLDASDLKSASAQAIELLADWCEAGWAHGH
ncbi:50S ribosomal protein L16 3-hydroxylase [Burkholderiales bacterium 8X]|nr:50S ribosomal protein L16 3-hydroxylase [Burkholderiales bacterium 8X]